MPSLKKCIWCKRTESEISFDKEAHTVPKNLGGKNVCDDCNHYFGTTTKELPAIEIVIKETFNISRAIFLHNEGELGKNRAMPKYSSEYFKVDFTKPKLSLKPKYRFNSTFQQNLGRQMKRGIYKMFLEENERQFGTSHDSKFEFIKEFARRNIGNYPIFYFERIHGIIMMSTDWAKRPELMLEDSLQMKYLIRHPSFSEFEFLGHVFGIATSRMWEISYPNYFEETSRAKRKFFKGMKQVNNFNDVDLTMDILSSKKRH